MIFSVTEMQQQMAEMERRRQQVATAAMQAPAAAVVATPAPAAAVVKAAAPDIAKPQRAAAEAEREPAEPVKGKKGKRGKRDRREGLHRPERVEEPQTPATAAHEAAVAGHNAMLAERDEPAVKALTDATPGPGHGMRPGQVGPEDSQHGYVAAGHAAESPMAEPPRANPVHHAPPGFPQQISLPDTPMVGQVPQHIAAAYTSGSPSDR